MSSSAALATFCTLPEHCCEAAAAPVACAEAAVATPDSDFAVPSMRAAFSPTDASVATTELRNSSDQRVDPALARLALRLLGARRLFQPRPLDRVVAEHRDRARHAADLVLAVAAADLDRGIPAGERQRGADQRAERPGDRARRHIGGERSDRDQSDRHREREPQRRGGFRRHRARDRLEVGRDAILDLLQLVDPRGRGREPVRRRDRVLGLAGRKRDRGVAHARDVGARRRGERRLQRILLRRRTLATHHVELLLLARRERHEAAQVGRAEAAGGEAARAGGALLAGEFLAAHHRRVDPDRAHDPGIGGKLGDRVDGADDGADRLGIGGTGLGRGNRERRDALAQRVDRLIAAAAASSRAPSAPPRIALPAAPTASWKAFTRRSVSSRCFGSSAANVAPFEATKPTDMPRSRCNSCTARLARLGERGRGQHLVGGGGLLPRLDHHRAREDRKPDQRHEARKGDLLGNAEVRKSQRHDTARHWVCRGSPPLGARKCHNFTRNAGLILKHLNSIAFGTCPRGRTTPGCRHAVYRPATPATAADLARPPKEKLRPVCYLGGPSGLGASACRARPWRRACRSPARRIGPALQPAAARLRIHRIKAWRADHSDSSRAQRAAGIAFLIRVASAALIYRQPGAVRPLDGLVRVRRLRLCVDLGAAARRPGRSRHRDRRAALHSGIYRPQAARHAARLPLRRRWLVLAMATVWAALAALGIWLFGDHLRFLRDHAALHRLRRPAAVHARPPAGRHGALVRLDQPRADAALRHPLAADDRRDGRGLLAQAADRCLDRDARRDRHHLGHGDRPDAGDEPAAETEGRARAEELCGRRVARGLAADLHGGGLLPAAHACRRAAAAAVSRARRGRGLLRGRQDPGAGGVRVVLGLGRDRAQVLRISRRRQQGAALRVSRRRDQMDVLAFARRDRGDPRARQAVPLAVRPAIRRRLFPDVHSGDRSARARDRRAGRAPAQHGGRAARLRGGLRRGVRRAISRSAWC